jgi:hypothetical protein
MQDTPCGGGVRDCLEATQAEAEGGLTEIMRLRTDLTWLVAELGRLTERVGEHHHDLQTIREDLERMGGGE